MADTISQNELRRNAMEFIRLRAGIPIQAWPRFGRDVILAEEDGPAGSLLFSCRTDASMCNPLGIVHGGVTAALVDTCMGITCAAQCGSTGTPTITMTVNYARPVPPDADIRVRAHTVRVGHSSGQMSAEVFLPEAPDELLVTATGVYSVKRPRP